MKPFKGLVIKAGGDPPTVRTFATFEEVQAAVEGDVQHHDLPDSIRTTLKIGSVDALFNEDGKLTLPFNPEATKLLADNLFWGDYVCGTVILAGERNGAWRDVPEPLVEAVMRRAQALSFPGGGLDADAVGVVITDWEGKPLS